MFDLPTCPIPDIKLRPLVMNNDQRGAFSEVFRACWNGVMQPLQWSAVRSGFNVVRGVHVHVRHVDYVVSLLGRCIVGLSDLRQESATFGTGCLLELSSDSLASVEIPPGVAHGFFFPVPNILLHGASEYFDPADDIDCRWDDPALHIPWPKIVNPVMSPRDCNSGTVAEALAKRRACLGTPARRQAA